jgi:hypothetical protein
MLYICCYKYVFVLVVERYTQAVSKSYIRFDCGETSERDGLQGSSPCQEQTLFITVANMKRQGLSAKPYQPTTNDE